MDIFLIPPWKHMWWLLIISASLKYFCVSITYVFMEKIRRKFTWCHILYRAISMIIENNAALVPIRLFFFFNQNTDIILFPPWKRMLWVPIRSASVRRFKWVPTTYVFWRNQKNIDLDTLLSRLMNKYVHSQSWLPEKETILLHVCLWAL